MEMNAYFADAIQLLLVLAPFTLALIALRFPRIPWWILCLSVPFLGLLLIRGYFFASHPPNMAFGVSVQLMGMSAVFFSSSLVFGLIALVVRFSHDGVENRTALKVATLASILVCIALPVSACLRWVPESQARKVAGDVLASEGYGRFEFEHIERTWSGWRMGVSLPGYKDYSVRLSRSGLYTGAGGSRPTEQNKRMKPTSHP